MAWTGPTGRPTDNSPKGELAVVVAAQAARLALVLVLQAEAAVVVVAEAPPTRS